MTMQALHPPCRGGSCKAGRSSYPQWQCSQLRWTWTALLEAALMPSAWRRNELLNALRMTRVSNCHSSHRLDAHTSHLQASQQWPCDSFHGRRPVPPWTDCTCTCAFQKPCKVCASWPTAATHSGTVWTSPRNLSMTFLHKPASALAPPHSHLHLFPDFPWNVAWSTSGDWPNEWDEHSAGPRNAPESSS